MNKTIGTLTIAFSMLVGTTLANAHPKRPLWHATVVCDPLPDETLPALYIAEATRLVGNTMMVIAQEYSPDGSYGSGLTSCTVTGKFNAPGAPVFGSDYGLIIALGSLNQTGDWIGGAETYHTPGPVGTIPSGGSLTPCKSVHMTTAQVNTIFSRGCLAKSFNDEQGGFAFWVGGWNTCQIYLAQGETNYAGQLCYPHQYSTTDVTVCPNGTIVNGWNIANRDPCASF